MEYLKEFAITLTTISVFIVAVELVMPENSMKKYQHFVLSLIMLAVMITPIIKLFNVDTDFARNIERFIDEELSVNGGDFYETEVGNSFVVQNLEVSCRKLLEEKIENYKFDVEILGNMDLNEFKMNIEKIDIAANMKNVKDKEEINIEITKELEDKVKNILVNELDIDSNKISVK
ncbi:MAG: stage III sporulation protein AF [Sarcina sp.]